jgi:hypothetical protein
MRIRVQFIQPDGHATSLDAIGSTIRLGRDPACEVAVDPVAFSMVSGTHAELSQCQGASLWFI